MALPAFIQALRDEGLADAVSVVPVDCMDRCSMGPVCRFAQQRRWAYHVTPDSARQLAIRLARDKRLKHSRRRQRKK